jgi:hypothetical protein
MEQADSAKAVRPPDVVPKDLAPVALASTQKQCGMNRVEPQEGRVANTTCKDYKVSAKNSKHLQLTAADRANGYEETWCVTTAYLTRIGQAPWGDEVYVASYAKHGGAWHFVTEYALGTRGC